MFHQPENTPLSSPATSSVGASYARAGQLRFHARAVKRIHPRCNNLYMNTADFFLPLFFFLCGRYMILSRIEGGLAKKKKKRKRKRREGREEIRARSRPVDHGSHESGTAWQTKEVFERRIPHLFKQTDWNGKGHGGVGWLAGWLVGWLVTRLEEGVGSLPTIKSQITSSDTLHRLVASSWLPCLILSLYIYICESNWSTNVLNPCSEITL